MAMNTCNNRRTVGSILFYMVHVISKGVCGSVCVSPYHCLQRRRVHGCGGSTASLLKNETKIFLPIFNLEKRFHTSKY
jgi:hypothetical protein